MRPIILSFISSLFILQLAAQLPAEIKESAPILMGSTQLEGLEFEFQNSISKFEMDSLNERLYVTTRLEKNGRPKREGYLYSFELDGALNWMIEFDHIDLEFYLLDTIPALLGRGKSLFLDPNFGSISWKLDATLFVKTYNKGRALGYMEVQDAFVGVDLKINETKWRGETVYLSEVLEIDRLQADYIILSTKKIYRYDIDSGQTSEYKVKNNPSSANYASSGAAAGALAGGLIGGALGAIAGGLVGASADKGDRSSTSYDLSENPLLSSFAKTKDGLIVTDKNEVYSLSLEGEIEIQWFSSLPKPLVDRTYLMSTSDMVYLLNSGKWLGPNGPVYAHPFFGAYDLKTGLMVASVDFPGQKGEYIKDFHRTDSSFVLLTNSRYLEFKPKSLQKIREHAFGNPQFSNGLNKIVHTASIIVKGEKVIYTKDEFPTKCFLKNTNGMAIQMSSDMEPEAVYRGHQFYEFRDRSQDFYLFESNDDFKMFHKMQNGFTMGNSSFEEGTIQGDYFISILEKKLTLYHLEPQ